MIPKFETDFEQIKYWYDTKCLSLNKVRNLVGVKITEEDFFKITGEKYKKVENK